MRGADEHGNVANFVETEQVLFTKGENKTDISSFVQVKIITTPLLSHY
jgi:hypothetical protein